MLLCSSATSRAAAGAGHQRLGEHHRRQPLAAPTALIAADDVHADHRRLGRDRHLIVGDAEPAPPRPAPPSASALRRGRHPQPPVAERRLGRQRRVAEPRRLCAPRPRSSGPPRSAPRSARARRRGPAGPAAPRSRAPPSDRRAGSPPAARWRRRTRPAPAAPRSPAPRSRPPTDQGAMNTCVSADRWASRMIEAGVAKVGQALGLQPRRVLLAHRPSLVAPRRRRSRRAARSRVSPTSRAKPSPVACEGPTHLDALRLCPTASSRSPAASQRVASRSRARVAVA